MPRAFDSDDEPARLSFTENVTCPACEETFEGFFIDYTQSLTVQDIAEPPRGDHLCGWCGFSWESEMTGWTFFSEAG